MSSTKSTAAVPHEGPVVVPAVVPSCLPPSRHHRFIHLAQEACVDSDDPDTQVGCVFRHANGRDVLVQGTNRLVNGCTNTKNRVTRPGKYDWIEHAERNAIYGTTTHCSFSHYFLFYHFFLTHLSLTTSP
jgi:deoxycytidylate deaminase